MRVLCPCAPPQLCPFSTLLDPRCSAPAPQTDAETRALCRQLVQSGKLAAVQKALNNRIGSSYSGTPGSPDFLAATGRCMALLTSIGVCCMP